MYTDFINDALNVYSEAFTEELKNDISSNISKYIENEINRNLYIKTLLHRAAPVNITKIYQPLNLKDLGNKNIYSKIDNLNNLFKISRYITILGDAGSGKSTLLKYLFVRSIKDFSKITIFIELRNLNNFKGDIIDFIKLEIFNHEKSEEFDLMFEKLLVSGKFIFIFDGYDEVGGSKKDTVTRSIISLIKHFGSNNYIISSRPHTGIESMPLFVNLMVCDLEQSDIEEFIQKQIPKEKNSIVQHITQAIKDAKNKDYQGYLKNPLLLSMFILTFQSYPKIPNQKSVFYRNVFDTLFYTHDSHSKLGYEREKKCNLTREQFETILRRFSLITFFSEKFNFSFQYLNDLLTQIKAKKPDILFNNDEFISDLQISIGILKKEGLEYQFPHRSLQEYFAAGNIAYSSENIKSAMYDRLSQMILHKNQKINELNNFYILLQELDYIKATELLLIPLLESLINYKNSFKLHGEIAIFYRMDEIISLLDIAGNDFTHVYEIKDKINTSINKIKKIEYFIAEGKTKIKNKRIILKELINREKQIKKERNFFLAEKNWVESDIHETTLEIKRIDEKNYENEQMLDSEKYEVKKYCEDYFKKISSFAQKTIVDLKIKIEKSNKGEQDLFDLI